MGNDIRNIALGSRGIASIVFFISILAGMCLPSSAFASSHSIERVSTDSSGAQGNSTFYVPSISSDGRYVAFHSWATNVITGDTNSSSDIFVKDTQTGAISRVSTDSSGAQANGISYSASISSDGRYVAFYSNATNLVTGDINGNNDIFVKDTQTGAITRESTDSSGAGGAGSSYGPSISADGRYVAFYSWATNLVPGDTNGDSDIFVKDTQTGAITRASSNSAGAEGNADSYFPSLSANGRYVAFYSWATNLVPGDTNGSNDIFVKDTQTGAITRVSTDSVGAEGDSDSFSPSISANGKIIAFYSSATNLVSGDANSTADVFVKNTQTGAITRVSTDSSGAEGDGESILPSLSADGRYVAFRSDATNLVAGDANSTNDVFLKDTQTGAITRVSTDSSGTEGNGSSTFPSISGSGKYIAFSSDATNLVAGDTNGFADVFRSLNPTWVPATVRLWPRASSLKFGLWSKLAGTVVGGSSDPVEGQKVWLQYKDGATWKWLKNVYTNEIGYFQHWFYYEGGTRTYRAKESTYSVLSNTTQIALTNNIGVWNNYRPTVKYCQWTKIHGKYGGPNGLYKNTTLYLQRMNGSTPVWQATVTTNSFGYYAAWAPICPTTQLRMGTAGSAVTSAAVTKTGSTINAWQNSKVHAVLKDGFRTGVPGISLYLQSWNGSKWIWRATCSTSSTGYCNFGSVNPTESIRVATWGSRVSSPPLCAAGISRLGIGKQLGLGCGDI